MSFKKMKGIWSTIKCKIHTWISEREHNEILEVKPMRNCCNEEDVETEHLTTYRTIWSIINTLAYIVGLNVTKYNDMEINFRLGFISAMIFCGYSSIFYTVAVVWPNAATLLEVICLLGVLLPATFKFRLAIYHSNKICSLYKFFECILVNNVKGRRANYLEKEMKIAFRKIKIFIALTLLCFAIFTLYPIYAYVTENRLIPIMTLEFPFVDQSEMKGYLTGVAIMFLFGFLATVGSVSFDLMIISTLFGFGSLVTQLELDLEDFHHMWTNESFSTEVREYSLKNICLKCQDINGYIRYFNTMFSDNTFHSICALYGALICAVYAVFNNGWISGYGFCIFCFVQVYILCILGTYVKDQKDKLNQAFYFTPWYEYPVKVQKTFLVLLRASSSIKELSIGGIARLNVETALKITKSIYSYYTAMNNL